MKATRIITITNNKGGVGKTTTAVNLGAALSQRGYKVLLIDYDAQANLSDSLRVKAASTIYQALQANKQITPVEVISNLSVIISDNNVSALESEWASAPDRLTRFSTFVERYRGLYDYILIDTAPTLGLITLSALYAADMAIIPIQPHYLAVKGVVNLYEVIERINALRKQPITVKILFCQYDKRKSLHRLTVEQIQGAGFSVYNTMIRDNVALSEAPAAGLDIFRYAPQSRGAQDYNSMTDEFLKG